MNSDANEFFPSNETGTRSTTFDEGDDLFTVLKTNHQIATARSILHEWNTATTLSALTREWSSCRENQPTERNSFSLVLYNISSLQMHLEDLIEHISESYPNIWALTGLHFIKDDANYQLASYFNSRYTIYYQHGSNSFGGVCLAIAREVPHRIASEFNNINNLIAADVFNPNEKYTVAVVYSPPSKEVPINIFNRLHQYNRNLILIGDLNARHPNWHDVTSNSCGHRLAEWIDAKQNLKIFNSAKPTSTRSRAVIDLIITPCHVSSDLAEINQKMRVSNHYPLHWRLSSFNSHSHTECEVNRIDWVVLNWMLNLRQNFFFALSAQMRHQSIEFILVDEAFLVALQERCTTYHMTNSTFLFGEYYQAETQNSLSRSIDSIGRASMFSLFSEQVHLSWTKRGQASSMGIVLPRPRAERYAALSEPLEKAFQRKSNSNSRVSRWANPSSGNQCRCHDWTCSSILLGSI